MSEYKMWDTVLELKEDNNYLLGVSGTKFFISDFAIVYGQEDLVFIISYPSFDGLNLGKGLTSYVLNKQQVEQLFDISDISLKDLAKQMEEEFWKSRNEEQND